jgi:phosphinothricin acetyltransferase
VSISILPFDFSDWHSVRAIYLEGIATGFATFETDAPSWEKWDADHLKECRLAGRDESGEIVGWAALVPVSGRCVYAGVAEISVYVAEKARGKGVGTALLNELIKESEKAGLWTLQAGIFAENETSIKLHERCGFRFVGKRERIGQLDGIWKDTVLLERRSDKIGLQ